MRPQRTAENLTPAGQPTAAISSAEEYAILEPRIMESSLAAAREQIKKSNKVLCPWCLHKKGKYVFMTRVFPDQNQFKCKECGKTIGGD